MQYIYLKLRRLISELTVILKLLHKNLFTLIMKGQLIYIIKLLTDVKDALLLFKIQKAVQKNRGNTNIYDRIIKIVVSETEDRDDNSNDND